MFERTLQQEQWFKDSAYIKCGKKSHFVRECGTTQEKLLGFKNRAQNKGILEDNNRIKGIRECLIKHFAFYYNSACTVHEDAKYGIGWWL
jgi:hypothetical protein